MSERPTDALLENDKELDTWFEVYLRDQARRSGKPGGDPSLTLMGENHGSLKNFKTVDV